MVGALMLLGGTGGVAWSEQVVPSNIAAVVVATVPLWIAVIRWVFLRHDRPERAVSYTHLDVYKRQSYWRRVNTPPS